jgi:hypothetical protein
MIWLHGLYLQQNSDGFVCPWFVIMVYTTFPGIDMPVHHGLYLQQYSDGFVCPWFVIMVYTTFPGTGLPVHDLSLRIWAARLV